MSCYPAGLSRHLCSVTVLRVEGGCPQLCLHGPRSLQFPAQGTGLHSSFRPKKIGQTSRGPGKLGDLLVSPWQDSIKAICLLHPRTGGIIVDMSPQGSLRAWDQCTLWVLWHPVRLPRSLHIPVAGICPLSQIFFPLQFVIGKSRLSLHGFTFFFFFVPVQWVKLSSFP